MIKNIKDIELTQNVYNQIINLYNLFSEIDKSRLTFKEFKSIIEKLPDTHNIYL